MCLYALIKVARIGEKNSILLLTMSKDRLTVIRMMQNKFELEFPSLKL